SRNSFEEIDDSGPKRVLRPDHHEPVARDQLLEDLRAVLELVRRGSNVGSHRSLEELHRVAVGLALKERFDRRPDAIHNRSEISGMAAPAWPLQLFQGGDHRSAARMTQDDDQ